MRSGLQPPIDNTIVGPRDRNTDVKTVYLATSEADLVREIDRLTFDHGKTEIWTRSVSLHICHDPQVSSLVNAGNWFFP
jgi:hypothetical protein